jgi:polysaccharide biosynthesis/export protein
VTVQRNGRAESAMLSEIAADPTQNIQLQPKDAIVIGHVQKYFNAFGATGQSTTLAQLSRRFAFADSKLTLADALALAGGLQDDRANPAGLFLYRLEARETLRRFGVELTPALPEMVPTIYVVNLRDPSGYFLASLVPVHSEDLLYVSNAPAADLQKFLNILGSVTGSASSTGSAVRY